VTLPAGKRTVPVVLELAPDFSKRLSDATLVEASVAARLLGIRLLTLDATIALVPADATAATPAAEDGARRVHPAAPASSRSSLDSRPPAARDRHRLADAVRNLEEGAKLLAELQRSGR
jgi:hypothetical protein